jgi:formate hydrogenlyase subunit 6/NADH:ubiquinone oxidoreductase subunit I
MKRVSIEVDKDKCIGCKLCSLACPTDCLDFDEEQNNPVILSTRHCLVCHNCEDQCARSALKVSLV